MLTVDVIRSNRDLRSLAEEWHIFIEKIPRKNIFYTIEWISLNYKYFYEENSLLLLVIRNTGKMIAIAPLVVKKEKIGKINVRKVKFLSESWVDCFDIIIADENCRYRALEAMMTCLIKQNSLWDIIELNKIPEDSASLKIIPDILKKIGIASHINEDTRTAYIILNESWEEYYSNRGAKLRRNLRNRTKRLELLGKVSFKRYSGADLTGWTEEDIETLMEKVFHLSKLSWQGGSEEGTAISDQRAKQFILELSKCFAKKGWLDISLLFLNERPVAFRYGYIYNDVLLDHKPGYDPELFKYSPGRLLLAEVIKNSIDRNLREINMMHDFIEFKREWTTDERVTKRIMVFNKAVIPLSLYLYYFKFKPFVKKIVKQNALRLMRGK